MTASKIEWTDRSDWNPIRGCTRVSPGCGGPGPHGGCYAEAIAARFSDPGQAFHGYAERTKAGPRWTGKVDLVEDRLTLPLRWRKPAKIFVSSTSDLFHEKLKFRQIERVMDVAREAPHHVYQILTKRSERARDFAQWWCTQHAESELPSCVWIGVSIEDQQRADERREHLRETPAAVRFVSYEPALGPVDWPGWDFIKWLISGGESGPKARASHPDWHRAARDFCASRGIAYFFKQWGAWAPHRTAGIYERVERIDFTDGACMLRVGARVAGRTLDGRVWDQFPERIA